MPDEVGTEAARSDAPSEDESLFGDAPDGGADTATDEQDSKGETAQKPEGSETPDQAADDPQCSDNADKAAEEPEGSGDAQDQDAPPEGLKVVVSIKGGRATIGVQQPSSDPHIETFDEADLSELAQEVPAVIERARARWEDAPKHPAYVRPAPPARRRRRQQGAAQDAAAEGGSAPAQAQQQTLRLF